MNKLIKISCILLVCLTIKACNSQRKGNSETENYKANDLIQLVELTYKDINNKLPELDIVAILDETDIIEALSYQENATPSFIGNIETVVVSNALASTEPYSFILIKVDNKANIKKIKQEIIDNVDLSKWEYVEAEIAYVNNYGTVVMLIMSDLETVQKVYDSFKKATNNQLNTKLEKLNDKLTDNE